MKQKVLLALIALFSFVGAWAYDDPEGCVHEDQYYHYCLNPKSVQVGDEVPDVTVVEQGSFNQVEDEDVEVLGVYTFAKGVLTPVDCSEGVPAVNNYYIKVVVDDGVNETTAFVPFKAYDIVDPEIVWNEDSYAASVEGGMYKYYLAKHPWSYVWDYDAANGEGACWYPTGTTDEEKQSSFNTFEASHNWGYDWKAIFSAYPANQLLADFPTIGYANKGVIPVEAEYGYMYVDGEPENNPVFKTFGISKNLVTETSVIAKYSELGIFENNFYESLDAYSFNPEDLSLVGGTQTAKIDLDPESQGYGDVFAYGMTNNYAEKLKDAVAPQTSSALAALKIKLTPSEDFATQDELAAAAEEITYNSWKLNETSDIYLGDEKYPAIAIDAVDVDGEPVDIDAYDDDKVIVKFYTDAELKEEVDEMIHAGTYYVQVYVPGLVEAPGQTPEAGTDEPGNNPQIEPEPEMVAGYVPLGTAQKFTINKNTLEVVLQQIYMPYGSSLDDLKPEWIVKKADEDTTPTNTIVVENLGDIIKGTGWAAGEEAETVEPNQVRNYTTSSKPKAYVGRTYDEEGNVVNPGYEDYNASTNTSSANIVTTKGTLTVEITNEDLTKVFGFDDPEYIFTATTQGGDDVTEDVTVTREDKGTAEGEAVGFHDLTVTFDKTHYDLVLIVNGEEADKAQLEITPFDLAKDNTEEGGYGYEKEGYTEKFIIIKPEVIYNGETQFPDPIIQFKHDTDLGLVTLSDFTKWPVTGKGKRYSTDDYTYVHGGATYQYTLEGEEGKVPGSYSGYTKSVTRNAETAAVEEATIIKVDAVEGGNFTGSKTQTYKIKPAPLAVKVKDYVGDNAKAYMTPEFAYELETIDPSDVVAPDAEQKATLLAGVSNAIAAIEGGFSGYKKGDKPSETAYVITVSAAAQADKSVIMAMPNYALDFSNSNGSIEIKEIELALKAVNQNIPYPAPVEGKYSAPAADLTVSTTTVAITEGALPEGVKLEDLVTLEQTSTKVGENAGALVLKAKEGADDAIKFTTTNGDLNIVQLEQIYLSYENMAQALEDHKGKTVDVYLPNRKIKEDQWYAMVLPFEFSVPQFSNKLYYGVVDLLDTENASDDVSFKLTVGTVPANTPFLLKLAKDPAKNQAEAMTADQLAAISFEDVTIGDGEFAYNDAEKAPFSADAANHKFVGLYPTVEVSGANKFGKVGLAANEWFLSTADGGFYSGAGNPNQKMLQTDAFISFPTVEAGAHARFFVEDADGTVTAIEGIEAQAPAESADAASEGWYTINGVKLNAKPTEKGLYIFNGKKVYVK